LPRKQVGMVVRLGVQRARLGLDLHCSVALCGAGCSACGFTL
jgi:uncharacterized membrane protein YadS